ncbi:hypothetical protein FE257_002959 [Aspergillus nanangensis]|uniref:Uncharacterized protein n=1 Tax=Aspergillus nanangensis TaxID=2582783 RepID=A0AAD4CSP4_ASPNN|nr:hypothetical protein FE257_002959 [Aspergillus nanangensis]
MEAAASVGTQGLEGSVYKMAQVNSYLRANTGVNGLASSHGDTIGFGNLPLTEGLKQHSGNNAIHPQSLNNFTGFREIRPAPVGGMDGTVMSRVEVPDEFMADVTPLGEPQSTATTSSESSANQQKHIPPPLTTPQPVYPASPSTKNKRSNAMADFTKYRPKSSIPPKLPTAVYARQCVASAYLSRLDPYMLHRKEQDALQDHLCHLHVTVYLNIRNGILRLWTRNPMVSVSKEEAMGCAKDYRWMNLASFAYEWLVRNGYINFGCMEIPVAPAAPKKGRRKDGPVIVVIGAGMAGLGCARQLEGLFNHYHDSNITPRVIVVEGRRRIGGRIYSHPLQSKSALLAEPTVEMGAQIIVGFNHGNPLDQIIRGQLALRYHLMRDISTIYDIDGTPVDEVRDAMDQKLHNDILDRSGYYQHKSIIVPTAEGNRAMIDSGRDVSTSDGVTVRQYEEARASGTIESLLPSKRVRRGVGHKTAEIKPTSVPAADLDPTEEQPAAFTCQTMGWTLNSGVSTNETLNLDPVAKASENQTLGAVMDEGVRQYQRMLPLIPRDLRLINWHFANLEYANAANIGQLSLSGWDQDAGNEFEGEHSQVVGGYIQVPYGLYCLPKKLDLRTEKIVSKISYDPTGQGKKKAVVHCEDGEAFEADRVVFTGSLGVLKHQTIEFSPPLPDWKRGAIDRLGFGIMNKVVLVFKEPFWDTERDMFGLLRAPPNYNSMRQEDYSANRGRFYLFWNCIKTTGLPVLIALMAGDAAHQAERETDHGILCEVMSQLRNIFKQTAIPDPFETIVTRWGIDEFTRGSYSYVAAEARPGDYDLMAEPIGNLHFAGEATCGTHPATVHGAYLSGLRAASEIMETILDPIEVADPLVPEKGSARTGGDSSTATPTAGQKRKYPHSSATAPTPKSGPTRREAYDQAMWAAIYAELGAPAPRPARTGLNPFLLYQKDYFTKCRDQCDEARRTATNDPNAKAPRNEVRHALGEMWRKAPDEEKRPYIEQTDANRQAHAEVWDRWQQEAKEWDRKSLEVKEQWCAANPFEGWQPGSGVESSMNMNLDATYTPIAPTAAAPQSIPK